MIVIKERLLHHAIERSSWRYKKTRCHWDKDRYLHTEALGKNNLQEIKNLKAQAQTQTNQLRMGGVTLGCIKSINIFKTYVTAAWLCQSKSFKNITSFLNFDSLVEPRQRFGRQRYPAIWELLIISQHT